MLRVLLNKAFPSFLWCESQGEIPTPSPTTIRLWQKSWLHQNIHPQQDTLWQLVVMVHVKQMSISQFLTSVSSEMFPFDSFKNYPGNIFHNINNRGYMHKYDYLLFCVKYNHINNIIRGDISGVVNIDYEYILFEHNGFVYTFSCSLNTIRLMLIKINTHTHTHTLYIYMFQLKMQSTHFII